MTRRKGRPRLAIEVLASDIGVSVGAIHLTRDEAIELCRAIVATLDHHAKQTENS